MKKIFISLVLALALTLTACNNSGTAEQTTAPAEESSQVSQTEESSQTSQTTQTKESTANETEEETAPAESQQSEGSVVSMKGVCGEDITAVDFFKEHPDLQLYRLPFSVYTFEGFGYYSPSDGNADCRPCEPYNAMPFIDAPHRKFQRIDVGDEICGLKVTDVDGMLYDKDGEISLQRQTLHLSGELTLKGYIHLCDGDEQYAEEDTLLFYPANGEWKDMPFNYVSVNTQYLGKDYENFWCGNAPIISIGKVPEQFRSQISQISDYPEAVTVTISDIILNYCMTDLFASQYYFTNFATLEDIVF